MFFIPCIVLLVAAGDYNEIKNKKISSSNLPKALSMAGDMRKVAVTRVAAISYEKEKCNI